MSKLSVYIAKQGEDELNVGGLCTSSGVSSKEGIGYNMVGALFSYKVHVRGVNSPHTFLW